ncbi:MAG TPA: LpqB family beta-propeller domain-containing protein [Mycobacteriales bacterium]|nr:LpqB family beta-propeller domain-containing protein [Mycobacteriales bacterium]
MRSWRGVAFAAIVMLATGCAGVPDSGSLHLGRPVPAAGGGLADATVREVPAGPLADASRVDLVRGFLRAMVDSDDGYGVARSYLAPGTSWNANAAITVYADPARVTVSGSNSVLIRATRVGRIVPRGTYVVDGGSVSRRMRLTRDAGEWRISRISAGVLLSSDDAQRLLQPASVFFLTPDGTRVVPEPVLEPPQGPGLATTLMRALVSGPGPVIASGVRTAIPHGTSLLGNVPISADGVAEVDLSASARQVTPAQITRLSAQVVWTLRQLTSITGIRLLVNGDPLTAPGLPAVQPARSWPQFDPAAPPTSTGALLVRAGSIVGVATDVPRALRVTGLSAPVRSADGSLVAALRGDPASRELVTGTPTGALAVRLRVAHLTAPSFGPEDRVIVASPGAVYLVPATGTPQRMKLPSSLAGETIRAVAMSRDGTRVALAVGRGAASLVVATLAGTDGHPALSGARTVLSSAEQVSGVAWTAADQMVTTVRGHDGRRGVVEVGVDGYQALPLSELGLPADVDDVAASPGQLLLASGAGGTWQLVGHRWGRLSTGVEPSYAGG